MNIIDLSACEAVRLMRSGEMSVTEYVNALIIQLEAKSHLNAFILYDAKKLRHDAKKLDDHRISGNECGSLFGLPLAVKDNIETSSYITTGGTGGLSNYLPKQNAPILQKLLANGALVLGKTNLHELAFGITSNNSIYGAVRNPYNPEMIAGGSSGGSAAAVAARMAPFAIGTDTGGSARIPPALCGIVGYRPTMGRYGSVGAIPISHTRDTLGTMARDVADIQLIDQIITDQIDAIELTNLKTIRLGVSRDYFYENLDPDTAKKTDEALQVLKELGAEIIEVNIDNIMALNDAVSFPICLYESIKDMEKYITQIGISFSELIEQMGSHDVKDFYEICLNQPPFTEKQYHTALYEARPLLQYAYQCYFEGNKLDAMVFPTSKLTARPIGQDENVIINGVETPTFNAYIHNTDPSSNAGLPGISIPIGLSSENLPIGLEFDGPVKNDRKIMQIAAIFQRAVGQLAKPE